MDTKSKIYTYSTKPIELQWETFYPSQINFQDQRALAIYLPGWSIAPTSDSVSQLCLEIAEKCQIATYAIQTRPEEIIKNSLYFEAQTIQQFLSDDPIFHKKNIILVAHSQGTGKAIYLAELLEKQSDEFFLHGLIIATPVGLYPQSSTKLQLKFIAEAIKIISKALREITTHTKNEASTDLTRSVVSYLRKDILKDSSSKYTKRLRNQTRELSTIYQKIIVRIKKIKSPIVFILAEKDFVSSSKQIKKSLEKNRLENVHVEEAKNVSHGLPYINYSLIVKEVKNFLN